MNNTTQTFDVTGMTCAHCVASVSEELRELDGVGDVKVELNSGGASVVTVTSDRELDRNEVQAAIKEAGYELVASIP